MPESFFEKTWATADQSPPLTSREAGEVHLTVGAHPDVLDADPVRVMVNLQWFADDPEAGSYVKFDFGDGNGLRLRDGGTSGDVWTSDPVSVTVVNGAGTLVFQAWQVPVIP